MAKGPKEEAPKKPGDNRQDKLAAELRANLKKRKDQARLRSAPAEPDDQIDRSSSPAKEE